MRAEVGGVGGQGWVAGVDRQNEFEIYSSSSASNQ